jgi:hypothetical protein
MVGGSLGGVGALAAADTWIVNAGRSEIALPSATLIVICALVPTFAAVGVPESNPDEASNFAHVGRFWMENVSASPSVSEALGWNV